MANTSPGSTGGTTQPGAPTPPGWHAPQVNPNAPTSVSAPAPAPAPTRAPAKTASRGATRKAPASAKGKLSFAELEAVAMKAGATPQEAVQLAAIAMAESTGNPGSLNDNPATGDLSYGLWQINMLGQMGTDRQKQWGLSSYNDLLNPVTNAKAAISLMRANGGFGDWTTYTSGAYKQYLPQAQQALPDAHSVDVAGIVAQSSNPQGGAPSVAGSTFDESLLEKQYGSLAVLLKNKELTNLVSQAVNNGWDDATFQQKLYGTTFYKQHSDAQRNWLLLKATDPGEATKELTARTKEVTDTAATLGISLSAHDLRSLADQSLSNAFDATQLNEAVGAHFQYTTQHAQGQAGTYEDSYTKLANDYGVNVSGSTVGNWIAKTLTGQMTPDTVKALVEQQATTMYPGLAQQIKAGMTVADVAQPYRDTMANILELDPASVSIHDPKIKQALQYMPDPSKPPTLMPQYQFEQQMRQDPRWLKTNNAQQSLMDSATGLLQKMGLAL